MRALVKKSIQLVDQVHVQRREGKEQGRLQRARACEVVHWSLQAAGVRAREATGRRRKRGTEVWSVTDVEAHRRTRWGGPRWSEASGKRAATVQGRTVARSRACIWLAWPF